MGKSRIGIPRTEKTKEKISKSHLGLKPSNDTRKKMSDSAKGKKGKLGKNWRGGITPLYKQIRNSEKYSNWRTQVFGRDDFTCRECGTKGIWLEAHHIKPFSKIIEENNIATLEEALMCEELWDIDNGITYCEKCHMELHGLNKKEN